VSNKKPFDHLPWNGLPYNFFGDYLSRKHGCRVFKLSINAGLGCPNRDGTVGSGGCVFCSETGSASPTAVQSADILAQMDNAAKSFGRTFEGTKYIAYFQAFTNTYAEIPRLKDLYDTALSYPDTIGLMVGTRPDCVNDEKAALLSSYRDRYSELWAELGMQSSHNRSLEFLRRGHSHEDTLAAIDKLASRNIDICLHVILGIPGETWDDMMHTAEVISSLPVRGVKIHHLHVIRGTALERIYERDKPDLLTLEEYVRVITDFLERIRPDITVHRIAGDCPLDLLIAPKWGALKGSIQTGIYDEFVRRGSWQGFLVG
jgi:radical SAM protein (TIGR01212 family)